MNYNAIPVVFVGVESGHIKGPGKGDPTYVAVETISTGESLSQGEIDKTRNVIVAAFEDLHEKANNRPAVKQLALKFDECRELIVQLLYHLEKGGDVTAAFILNQILPDRRAPNPPDELE
jgi:hypothetical protein